LAKFNCCSIFRSLIELLNKIPTDLKQLQCRNWQLVLCFAIDRLIVHWSWSEAWRRVIQCLSTQAVEVLARQLSTFAYMQDVQCTQLLVLRRNEISSKSSIHRYLDSPVDCLKSAPFIKKSQNGH
jgi:hypothetical protein